MASVAPTGINIEVYFDEAGFDHVLGGSVGIGEVATVPTSPAIANAICNATGIRLTEIPIRPDVLIAALKGMGPPPGPPSAGEGAAPVAGAQGPPPQIAALGQRLQFGGIFLTLLLTAIIVLMVWHPGCQGICT